MGKRIKRIKRRAKADARAAERKAIASKDTAKRKVKQDVRALDRAASEEAREAKEAVRDPETYKKAARKLADGKDPNVGGRSDSTAERAEQAASMGAPLNATLDPLTAPEETRHFASGGRGESRVDDLATGGADDGMRVDDLATGAAGEGMRVDDLAAGGSGDADGQDLDDGGFEDFVTMDGDAGENGSEGDDAPLGVDDDFFGGD